MFNRTTDKQEQELLELIESHQQAERIRISGEKALKQYAYYIGYVLIRIPFWGVAKILSLTIGRERALFSQMRSKIASEVILPTVAVSGSEQHPWSVEVTHTNVLSTWLGYWNYLVSNTWKVLCLIPSLLLAAILGSTTRVGSIAFANVYNKSVVQPRLSRIKQFMLSFLKNSNERITTLVNIYHYLRHYDYHIKFFGFEKRETLTSLFADALNKLLQGITSKDDFFKKIELQKIVCPEPYFDATFSMWESNSPIIQQIVAKSAQLECLQEVQGTLDTTLSESHSNLFTCAAIIRALELVAHQQRLSDSADGDSQPPKTPRSVFFKND